jgi:L-iditol 2-dehydrogenase
MGERRVMKACVLHAVGDLRYEDAPMPVPAADEVLIRIRAAGICGSDVPRVYTKGTYHFPTIPGHEFSGEAVAVNPGDEAYLGGRFAVYPLIPCGNCEACRAEAYQQCGDYDYYGSRRDGAFAEYLAVKKWNLVAVPDGVSYEEAAMCEPCAVAIHALKRAGLEAGDTLAIFGAGAIGILAAQVASGLGASRIIFCDIDQKKLDFVAGMGFVHTVNTANTDVKAHVDDLTAEAGVDIALDAAGVSAAVENTLRVTRREGKVVLLGNPAGDMTLTQKYYWEILRKQLTLKGTWNSSFSAADNDWRLAIQYMENGIFKLKELITDRFPFSACAEAFAAAADRDRFSVKVMFVNGGV